MNPATDPRRTGSALVPAWSTYLWEIAVLVLAAAKFPHHLVLAIAIAAVYILRSLAPFATASVAAAIDTWPLARAWQRLMISLGIASVAALIIPGSAWWIAVVALELGHALVTPLSRKVLYAGLEANDRKILVKWLGTAENIAMPVAYAVMLVFGPTVGLLIMAASYGTIAYALPAAIHSVVASTPTERPSWMALWRTTRSHPIAWKALLALLPIAALLAPLNPLSAILVHSRFHAGEAWVGLLFAGLSIGTIGGYQWASHLPIRRSIPLIVVGLLGLAMSPSLIVATASLAVMGLGFGAFMSAQRQVIATQIPDDQRGQIQLMRQAAIAAATIAGTLIVLGAWAIAPDLAWILLVIGGMILMIQTIFSSLQTKLIAAAAAVIVIAGIFALSQGGTASTPAGTWSGTVNWEQGDVGHDTVSLHSAGSNSYVGTWTDQEPGSSKTVLSATASPGPDGTWVLSGGASFLGSFSLTGQIHGSTWRGTSSGLGARGSFVLHRK